MSDDFGTVNVRRGDRAREIEVMRQRYRAHRDTLQRLAADAPTDHLATEYQRLAGEIDVAMAKLDELEGRGSTLPGQATPPPPPPRTSAGDRPLAGVADESTVLEPGARPNPGSRVAIIIVGGVIVLLAIVFLIWRGSERKSTGAIVEQPSAVTTADTAAPSTAPPSETGTVTPAFAASAIKVTPLLADYGVIRKGTRAVRQFDLVNGGSTPITIQVSRSACRCLFYEYNGKTKVAPKGKERITVTVDGAKAAAGSLRETLSVTAKEDPSATAQFTVQAIIK